MLNEADGCEKGRGYLLLRQLSVPTGEEGSILASTPDSLYHAVHFI